MDLYQIEHASITQPVLVNDTVANDDRERDNFWEYDPFAAPGPDYGPLPRTLYVARRTGRNDDFNPGGCPRPRACLTLVKSTPPIPPPPGSDLAPSE